MEALALARDANDPEEGRPPAGRRVLPLHTRNGRQERRPNPHRALRRTVRGRRKQAEAVRTVLRARSGRQALPVRRRQAVQPIQMRPEVFLLLRSS